MTNIEIPDDIRAKLAPLIVQCITTKLKESGVSVDEEAIRRLVNDKNSKIEFPAVVIGQEDPTAGPAAIRPGWHIVCGLLPPSEARLMGAENEITASTVLTLRSESAKKIMR